MDTCVMCGDYAGEGRQICYGCELVGPKEYIQYMQNKPINIIINDIPPSNNKFMGRGSKYIQQVQYQDEKQRWAWLVMAAARGQKKVPRSPIKKSEVKIVYYFKTSHRRDPDNYSGKFILDGLTQAGIIEDDSFNNIDLVLRGRVDKDNPRTEIYVTEVG